MLTTTLIILIANYLQEDTIKDRARIGNTCITVAALLRELFFCQRGTHDSSSFQLSVIYGEPQGAVQSTNPGNVNYFFSFLENFTKIG